MSTFSAPKRISRRRISRRISITGRRIGRRSRRISRKINRSVSRRTQTLSKIVNHKFQSFRLLNSPKSEIVPFWMMSARVWVAREYE